MGEQGTRQKQNEAIRSKVERAKDGRLLKELSLTELETLMAEARQWLIDHKHHKSWTFALRKFTYIQKLVRVKTEATEQENPELYEAVMIELVYNDF